MQSSSSIQPPEYGAPISLVIAKRVMQSAEAEAETNKWPMVIAIVDTTGHLVMLHKRDHAQLGSVAIAQLKAETALKFKRPTKVLEDVLAGGGAGLRLLTANDACLMEGGIPLLVDGKIVGAIGVSGMQSGQDAQVAVAGAKALE
jgi:glc operon protein GlcG